LKIYIQGEKLNAEHAFLILDNGDQFMGNILQGQVDHGQMIYKNGDVFIGKFDESGMKISEGKMLYKNGNVYQGDWWQNVRSGNGVITLQNGDQFDGFWTDDYPGKGKMIQKHDNKIEEGIMTMERKIVTKTIESKKIELVEDTYIFEVIEAKRE
jgi:hypothetical protein